VTHGRTVSALMAARNFYWKLGLFFVVALVCVVVVLSNFGSTSLGQRTVDYHTYFDESVGGLGVGSPVRFRGIPIGRVDRLGLAPDKRHVDVTCALATKQLRQLGLATQDGHEPGLVLLPDVRAQLGLSELTGSQAITIDFFDPATHPVPPLPFPTKERTIPSTRSTLGGLEDSLSAAVAGLPDLVARASAAFGDGSKILAQIGDAQVANETGETLRDARDVLGTLRRVIDKVGTERVPEQLGDALGALVPALSRMGRLFERLDGEPGLVTSAQRASEAVGDAARGSRDLGRELESTLQEVRRAAATIRRLADALDRNPDMLVKGRPKGAP
jgi:phospholipid/cholesterol/gamma-HCH transport system substrate-binding protein